MTLTFATEAFTTIKPTAEVTRSPCADYEMDVTDWWTSNDEDFDGKVVALFDFTITTPTGRGWYTVDDAALIGFKVDDFYVGFDLQGAVTMDQVNAIELRGVEIIRDLECEA